MFSPCLPRTVGHMQGDQSTTFAAAAESELRRAEEHNPLSPAALYWATVGSARATLAVVEELRRAREGAQTAAQKAAAAPPLGSRERELLTFLGNGRTNAEIAEHLHISPYTVKDHASSLYRKLGARNRAEAVRLAQEFGLL
jgi:DNA-binding NarL/FixJ family response regulator